MKILHTSDWHIGHRLYSKERDQDHKLFFDWLIETIEAEKIDLLLVAGDIFDIGFPSNSALKLYYETLTRISNSHCRNVIITGGNHDSISTIDAPKDILNFLNIKVIGGISRTADNEIDYNNEIVIIENNGKAEICVCAAPYLRDRDIRQAQAGENYEARNKAIREGIIAHYQQLYEHAKEKIPAQTPIIAMGHLFAIGVKNSDSERDIHIGTLGNVDASDFANLFQYVALGHIHRPQRIGGTEHIRYSGSPIPLSFSEKNDKKQVIIFESTDNNISNIQSIEIPTFRKLLKFTGNYKQVEESITNFKEEGKLETWAEIEITEEKYSPEIKRQIEDLRATTESPEILRHSIIFMDADTNPQEDVENTVSLKDLEVKDVFERRIANLNTEEEKEQLRRSFAELIEHASLNNTFLLTNNRISD